ncbi:uncharacterized protein MELLADRAFT_95193 [Melampsora larici-populina 98AG31]|uniref:Uncharacterized protein n=1 Tax=Melampsora larici-populina (strain 98AG31 / pathotype 3-4-7) TaxID=747676 RepID=F4RCG7_MELLP|nr:uncharacterized protein MELLADRAFT_95193 [Melampsora larici-populina 98AG31]EGG09965.1 hypothetical protein MELLADRAFT_95193 [Melampsora larici-populina 98AG31]
MSSQPLNNRAQPYSLTTPRGVRNPIGATSANRALARSVRGSGSASATNDDTNEPDTNVIDGNQIMAAITSLNATMVKEFLVLSDNLQQDTVKSDEDIATLSHKLDEDLNAVAEQIEAQLLTLSNKLDQVIETVEGQPQAPGAAAAAPVAQPAAIQPWDFTPALKDRVYGFAYDSVAQPNIAAYTARETPAGDIMANSLYNIIKQRIRNIPGDWATGQLPPVVNGVQSVAGTQKYNTLVKTAGKHAQERLHILVLHNIKNNPESTVPCLKRLLHHCGEVKVAGDFMAYWPTTSVAHRIRIAYIRREAIRIFQLLRNGGGGGNIWSRVDRQLHKLSVQGTLYTSAFYKLIYETDRATFDGEGFFVDVDPKVTFDLPSEEEIQEEMERLETAGGSMVLTD